MRIAVLAFARLREVIGSGSLQLQIADGARTADVWDVLAHRYEGLLPLRASTRFARNGVLMRDDGDVLEDGDEIALLPPVGGG
jgi:molybdopterin converting factor small subunit